MRGRPASGRNAGFTLIELLVAMTILALIAIVAVSGLQMIGQAWARRETASAAIDQQSRALDLLAANSDGPCRSTGAMRRTIWLPSMARPTACAS